MSSVWLKLFQKLCRSGRLLRGCLLGVVGRVMTNPARTTLGTLVPGTRAHCPPSALHRVNLAEFLSDLWVSPLYAAGRDFIWPVLRKSLRWIRAEMALGKGENELLLFICF